MTQRRTPPPSGRARPASAATRGPAAPAHRSDAEGSTGGKAATGSTASGSGSQHAGHRSLRRRPPERGAALRRPPRGHTARPAPAPPDARSAPARRPTNPTRGRTGGSGGGSGRRSTAVRGGTPAGNPRRRMRFLTVASLFVLSVFGAQLVRIQGFDATAVAQEAQLKREAAQIIPAMRGQVLASDGTVLASSVVREVVVADQQAVCTYGTKKNTCDPATSDGRPCRRRPPSSPRCSTPRSPSWCPSSPAPAATASSAATSRR